jgi:hypothetical protein
LEEKASPVSIVPPQMTVQELIAKAEKLGFKQADIVTGARVYHNQPNIYRLTPDEIADLDRRITARVEKLKATAAEAVDAPLKKEAAAGGEGASRTQPTRNLKRA